MAARKYLFLKNAISIAVCLFGGLLSAYPVHALNSNAAELNGVTQYLSAVDSPSLSIVSSLTVEMWIKLDTINTGLGDLVTKYGGGANDQRGYLISYSNPGTGGKFETRISTDGTGSGTSVKTLNYALSTNTWYHLAFVYDAPLGVFDVYIASSSDTIHIHAGKMSGHNTFTKDTISAFILGSATGDLPTVFYDGKMDDVRVWNIARTKAQMDADFKSELTGSEEGLVAYWTFNNGSLEDLTANNNDLTAPQGFTLSDDVPFVDAPPAEPDPVIVIPGILGSWQSGDVWKIDPILHTYDNLIETLDDNHFTPGVDLFTFPYDWRASNVVSAALLKQKITEVKGVCQCDKVDLIAHSMGGLIARQYIQSADYVDDVDQLIFLGTPHLGAPKAYLMWEGAEVGLSSISNFLFKSLVKLEASAHNYSDSFSYIQGRPILSVQELLPTYDYLSSAGVSWAYPVGYPANPFLSGLNSTITNLLNAPIDIHAFVGNTGASSTVTGISIVDPSTHLPLWPHGYPEGFYENSGDRGLEMGSGDDTVPLASASFIQENAQVVSSSHTALPTDAEGAIYQILTGEVAGVLSTQAAIERLLHIKIYSPADLLVISPNGEKIGVENGNSVNEISGAFYTGTDTDTEFITIPNPIDGEYVVQVQGTGSGAYTVEATYLTNDVVVEDASTGETAPGLISELQMIFDGGASTLELKSADVEPPIIVIASPLSKTYFRPEPLSVNVSATDASGVKILETKLGTTSIPSVGTIDLFFQKLGSHTLSASSTDTAGNATTTYRTFVVGASATSTLADLNRAYALGWVTKKAYDELTKKLKGLVSIKKTIKSVLVNVVETGRNGQKTTKQQQKKIEILEEVLNKTAAKTLLKELDKYRGKGLNEQAYQILKEDIQWFIAN